MISVFLVNNLFVLDVVYAQCRTLIASVISTIAINCFYFLLYVLLIKPCSLIVLHADEIP